MRLFNLYGDGLHRMNSEHKTSCFNMIEVFIISPFFKPTPNCPLTLRLDCISKEFYKTSTVYTSFIVITEFFENFVFEISFRQFKANTRVKFLEFLVFKYIVDSNFVKPSKYIFDCQFCEWIQLPIWLYKFNALWFDSNWSL